MRSLFSEIWWRDDLSFGWSVDTNLWVYFCRWNISSYFRRWSVQYFFDALYPSVLLFLLSKHRSPSLVPYCWSVVSCVLLADLFGDLIDRSLFITPRCFLCLLTVGIFVLLLEPVFQYLWSCLQKFLLHFPPVFNGAPSTICRLLFPAVLFPISQIMLSAFRAGRYNIMTSTNINDPRSYEHYWSGVS